MKSALRKNAVKEIFKTKSRFLSIFCIVAIGVAFFAGVKVASPDMKRSADSYFKNENLAHFRLVSTMGFSDNDIAALEAEEGLTVYAGYFTDVLIDSDENETTARIMSLSDHEKSNEVNILTITEGRFPAAADECIVDNGGFTGGRSIGDRIKLISGTEEELSEAGKQELLERKRKGAYPKAEIVFASPMKRCLQTAEILYPENKVIRIDECKEMDFGDFEGKNYQELSKREDYRKWIESNGTMAFPNGESREEFSGRVLLGMEKTCGRLWLCGGRQEGRAALIVHGGTIMALLSAYCGRDYFDYQAENGKGYRCSLILSKKEENKMKIQHFGIEGTL